MSFFKHNYTKAGPGVDPDEPRKKGVKRFVEILLRDSWDMFKLNLLFLMCIVPSLVAFSLGFLNVFSNLMFIFTLIATIPIGSALTALIFCLTKMLRDDPGYIWPDFKKSFSKTIKKATIPGMVYAAFFYSQIIILSFSTLNIPEYSLFIVTTFIILNLLFGMLMPYVFLQIAYSDAKLIIIIKNSFLICFANTLRSILGAFTGSLLYIIIIIFLPVSLFFLPVIFAYGIAFSWLLCLFWIWPVFDKQFSVEKVLREMKT